MPTLKMVVLGDENIGKSSMIDSFVSEEPCIKRLTIDSVRNHPVALQKVRSKQLTMPNAKQVNLQIHDTDKSVKNH